MGYVTGGVSWGRESAVGLQKAVPLGFSIHSHPGTCRRRSPGGTPWAFYETVSNEICQGFLEGGRAEQVFAY